MDTALYGINHPTNTTTNAGTQTDRWPVFSQVRGATHWRVAESVFHGRACALRSPVSRHRFEWRVHHRPGEPCREARTPVVPVGYIGAEPTALLAVGEGAHRLMTDAANTSLTTRAARAITIVAIVIGEHFLAFVGIAAALIYHRRLSKTAVPQPPR